MKKAIYLSLNSYLGITILFKINLIVNSKFCSVAQLI
jgi:hypothetical protein